MTFDVVKKSAKCVQEPVNNMNPSIRQEEGLNGKDSLFISTPEAETSNCSFFTGWSEPVVVDNFEKPLLYRGFSYNFDNQSEYDEMIKKNKVAIIDNYTPQPNRISKNKRKRLFGKTKTMDSQISSTSQGFRPNCSLLSAINALSYSNEGQKLIKNMINYDENGAYVTFNGINKTVYVPYKKIFFAKLNPLYSWGDDDMKIIEIATKKIFSEILDGNFGEKLQAQYENSYIGVLSSYPNFDWKLLIKDNCKEIDTCRFLDKPENIDVGVFSFTGNDYKDEMKFSWLTFVKNKRKVKDAMTGEYVNIYADHAYAIKSINNGIVELVNPWLSKKSIYVNEADISKGYLYYSSLNKSTK